MLNGLPYLTVSKSSMSMSMSGIFRDNTVESSIPDYFENKEPPIICYKYNKPIRSIIFNFNKLVANLDIDTKISKSSYEPAGHIITGNVKIRFKSPFYYFKRSKI